MTVPLNSNQTLSTFFMPIRIRIRTDPDPEATECGSGSLSGSGSGNTVKKHHLFVKKLVHRRPAKNIINPAHSGLLLMSKKAVKGQPHIDLCVYNLNCLNKPYFIIFKSFSQTLNTVQFCHLKKHFRCFKKHYSLNVLA